MGISWQWDWINATGTVHFLFDVERVIQPSKQLRPRQKTPLWAYATLGAAVGIAFPFAASLVEVLVLGQQMNGANIWAIWQGIPVVIRFGAPFLLGTFVLILLRTMRKAQRQEKEFSDSLVEYSETLEEQNRKLKQLNEALDGLVYSASHDLKTPVVNMRGLVSMLRSLLSEPDSGPMIQQVISRMDHSVLRFQETIADLMDVSRINREQQPPNEKISLKVVMDLLLEDFSSILSSTGGHIQTEIPEDVYVVMPRPSIQSILHNLLSNAIKYAKPGLPAEVSVSAKVLDNKVQLVVKDNGIGMDLSKDPDKLFRMFTRLSNSSEGSGVGLYIVKRSVEAAGGTVTVESELGKGTVFRVELPTGS